MIIQLNRDNLSSFDDKFIVLKHIKEEIYNNPFAKIFVYFVDNKIVGYIYYSVIYDRIELNQIEVLFEHRYKGIATILMERLLEEALNITLEVRIDNEIAINLYRKFGFDKVAIRKGYYNGVDGILMERRVKK